jgi:hypothetical protein
LPADSVCIDVACSYRTAIIQSIDVTRRAIVWMNGFLVFSLASDSYPRRVCHADSGVLVDAIFLSSKSWTGPGVTFHSSQSVPDRKSRSRRVRIICYCLKSLYVSTKLSMRRVLYLRSKSETQRKRRKHRGVVG